MGGPFTRPARGKPNLPPVEKTGEENKEPGVCTVTSLTDDATSGESGSMRTALVDGRDEVVKATMTWW